MLFFHHMFETRGVLTRDGAGQAEEKMRTESVSWLKQENESRTRILVQESKILFCSLPENSL